jgi:hypothetical protein
MAEETPIGPFPTFEDGNELFSRCEGYRTQSASPDERLRFHYCHAYVKGVADSLAMFKAISEGALGTKVIGYCPPERTNSHQVTSVAANYLRDYPEKRHLAAASLVANALAEKFPCN